MVHRIKSRHGLLRPYSGSDDNPHEGTGQGSGASPAIWLIYMVTLLNAFSNFSSGMQVASPYQNLTVLLLAIFFVDDGMPGVNDALDEKARPLEDMLMSAEQVTQSWERLLFVSGGALELSKCFVYVIYWDLSSGTHCLFHPADIPGCTPVGDSYTGPISLTYGSKSVVSTGHSLSLDWTEDSGSTHCTSGHMDRRIQVLTIPIKGSGTVDCWVCSVPRNSAFGVSNDVLPQN